MISGGTMKHSRSKQHAALKAVAASALAISLILAAGCSSKKEASQAPADAPAASQRVSVAVATPKLKSVEGLLSLNGTIRSENVLTVVAETSGKVVRVNTRTGAHVSKGDVLVQIDDELKQAAFATAQAALDKSKADWIRAQELYNQKVIPDADFAAAKLASASADSQFKAARRDLENARVRSPISGVVADRMVNEGAFLAPGTPVAQIVDTDDFKLVVNVGERDVMKIKTGMQVKIEADAYSGEQFTGTVSAVSPKGDASLSFPVEIKIKPTAKRPLYDGMSARVGINLGKRSIVAIPRASLVGSFQKPQVYVVSGGVARLADIAVGGEYGTDIELLSGLSNDDEVVVNGQNNLADGMAVDVVGDNQ
jgi:RND family efflux transporter MFP subunit